MVQVDVALIGGGVTGLASALALAQRGAGLVYPLPHASGAGLGVHLAKTTRGSVTLGPTLVQRDAINPRVSQASGIDSPGLTSSLAIGDRVATIWSSES